MLPSTRYVFILKTAQNMNTVSTSRILARNRLPNPHPYCTAHQTGNIDKLQYRRNDLCRSCQLRQCFNRGSGNSDTAEISSIVQKGN